MKKNLFTAALVSLFLLGGMVFTSEAQADPLDKKSPKIAHGMYRDRGKSSPKIAHGMYRDRGKSSPKIAHRTRRAPVTINVVDMVDVYFDLIDIGEYELADEVGMEVEDMVREMGYWRGGR